MKSFVGLAFTVILTTAAHAQHQTLTVNTDASEAEITLNTTHELVHGTFHVQSGSIEFDRSNPAMSGVVSVLASSGNTGNGRRDKRMKTEILHVDQYASVSFAPQSYAGTIAPSGDSTIQVSGILTLLNTPHEMTIPMHIHLESDTAIATAHFSVPYIQWGLKDPSLLFWKADKSVTISLTLTGHLSK